MQKVVYLKPPIPLADLEFIQRLLEKENIIISSFKKDELDVYHFINFIKEKEFFGTETYALLDRNIFSDVIAIVKGENVELRDGNDIGPLRIAAALMAFLQCAKILIEPNLSLYEYAATNSSAAAADELKLFRIADNLHPRVYADIVMRRKHMITEGELNELSVNLSPDVDFGSSLRYWRFNYTLALKLALLELRSIPQDQKMELFLQWMSKEFFVGASATFFASLYLSSKRMLGMLKKIGSANRERALLGIKNAAWDLTFMTTWSKKAEAFQETNRLWLLCSRDKALLRIASCLFATGNDEKAIAEQVKPIFVEHWGEKKGDNLFTYYLGVVKNCDDKHRQATQKWPSSHWKELTTLLEKEFLNCQKLPSSGESCPADRQAGL
jgi:hypothetical protein